MKKEEIEKIKCSISVEEKSNYLKRLSDVYEKQGKKKLFIEQYLNGDGSELKSKFWSKRSSSRIAFDLYSCLAIFPEIIDFEFEYQLPGIISGGSEAGKPNMDVFYIKNKTIYFIESKFSESPKQELPEAYYIKASTYKSTTKKEVTSSLSERFRENNYIAEEFTTFAAKYAEKTKQIDKTDWFDYKQEICHLYGIIFFSLNLKKQNPLLINKIDFKNIVFDFDEYESLGTDHISESAEHFIKDANEMITNIFTHENINITFEYGFEFTQNIIKKFSDYKAFGDTRNIKELMDAYLEF